MQKLTLIPRGQAKGLTWFIPGEDPTLISKQQIFARIVGALGGRATEEVIWGENEITTGASSDLAQVSNMARQMVSPPLPPRPRPRGARGGHANAELPILSSDDYSAFFAYIQSGLGDHL